MPRFAGVEEASWLCAYKFGHQGDLHRCLQWHLAFRHELRKIPCGVGHVFHTYPCFNFACRAADRIFDNIFAVSAFSSQRNGYCVTSTGALPKMYDCQLSCQHGERRVDQRSKAPEKKELKHSQAIPPAYANALSSAQER